MYSNIFVFIRHCLLMWPCWLPICIPILCIDCTPICNVHGGYYGKIMFFSKIKTKKYLLNFAKTYMNEEMFDLFD